MGNCNCDVFWEAVLFLCFDPHSIPRLPFYILIHLLSVCFLPRFPL